MRVIESSRRERWRDLSSSSFFFSETGSPQRIFNSAPSAAGCCARGEIRKRTRHFQHTENTHSHSVGRSHLVRWVLPINAHSLVRSLPTLRAPATMINPKSLFFWLPSPPCEEELPDRRQLNIIHVILLLLFTFIFRSLFLSFVLDSGLIAFSSFQCPSATLDIGQRFLLFGKFGAAQRTNRWETHKKNVTQNPFTR